MTKRKFHLIGIGPLFEDLIIDIRAKYTHEISYERGVMKHLCLEAGLKEAAANFGRSTGGSAANIVCMLSRLAIIRWDILQSWGLMQYRSGLSKTYKILELTLTE